MKLISCYIENFGAITKKEIRFEQKERDFDLKTGTKGTSIKASNIKEDAADERKEGSE